MIPGSNYAGEASRRKDRAPYTTENIKSPQERPGPPEPGADLDCDTSGVGSDPCSFEPESAAIVHNTSQTGPVVRKYRFCR